MNRSVFWSWHKQRRIDRFFPTNRADASICRYIDLQDFLAMIARLRANPFLKSIKNHRNLTKTAIGSRSTRSWTTWRQILVCGAAFNKTKSAFQNVYLFFSCFLKTHRTHSPNAFQNEIFKNRKILALSTPFRGAGELTGNGRRYFFAADWFPTVDRSLAGLRPASTTSAGRRPAKERSTKKTSSCSVRSLAILVAFHNTASRANPSF